MVKINLFDFQVLLKSAFHPLTPVFVGSWRGQFSTKWRGVSAELSYNTYLRNGWIVIDTGVKSETGTPIVEFSSWEPYVSNSNITFPNILSYKFFFKKAFWRVGFLTRTSVVANEEWAGSLPGYLSVYNNTKRGGFFRKNNWNFFLWGKPLNLIMQRFIFFRPGILHSFYDNTTFTWNFNRFYLFENLILFNRKVGICSLVASQFLDTIIYSKVSKFNKVGLSALSRYSVGFLTKLRKFTLYDILFKITTLFLLNAERGVFGGFTSFFLITLRTLISDFVFLVAGLISCSNSVINFLYKKFITLFEHSKLNFNFFLRVSGYAFSAIARFLHKHRSVKIPVLVNNYLLNLNLVSSKLRLLRQAQTHLSSRASPLLSGASTALRDFLQGFAPRFFTKKRANRAIFTRQVSFFTRKVGKFVNKGGARVAALVGTQLYPRLVKYRRKPVTRFKLSLFKKQFSFLHFWVINFFAFFIVKPSGKKLAWISIRLKFFFRAFLKFLKFYSFTSEYFSLAFQETLRQRTRFLLKFNSLRLYFWFLLKRIRGLLCAFWSFSSKLSRNYFTAAGFRVASAFPYFSRVALNLTKPSGLTTSFEVLGPLGSQLNIFSREVGALRASFLGLHSGFLSARVNNEGGLTFKVRNFLRFTLLIRRAAFYFFNRQLGITVGASETARKSDGFYGLNVSSLLRIIVEKSFFRVFLMSRKTFVNFIFRLRRYFMVSLRRNSLRAISAKRWLGLIAALGGSNRSRSVINMIVKTFCLMRRLILRRARKVGYTTSISGYGGVASEVGKLRGSEILSPNLFNAKQLFLKKTLVRLSEVVNVPYSSHYSLLRGIHHLMKFPLAERFAVSLPLSLFQQISFSTHELKLALLKIRTFIIQFSQFQARNNWYIISRLTGNFRPFSRMSLFPASRLVRKGGGSTWTHNRRLEFGLLAKYIGETNILGRIGFLFSSLTYFTLLNYRGMGLRWAVKSFSSQVSTIYQLVTVALGQNWERLGRISFLNFFTQMRSVTKTLAQRISNASFVGCYYSLQSTVFSTSCVTKIGLNRVMYLANAFYNAAANFNGAKLADLTSRKIANIWISVNRVVTTGVWVWRAFCLRFLPFFMVKRAMRKNIMRKGNVSTVQTVPVFRAYKQNSQVTFLNRRKIVKNTVILSLNLCKYALKHLTFISPRLLRSSKYLIAAKLFPLSSNLVSLPDLTGGIRKSFLFSFVRKVLAESAVFSSRTGVGDVGRMQEVAFRKVRAIRKILLRSNARRLGIFPKRNKHLKKMYWRLVNSGKLEPVVSDYINSQRSIFDRRNRHSMELSAQRAKKRFRFTTVKLQFTVKKQLWSQLILLLDRIKKIMRLFRVKLWRRRFYRLFRAGRWSIRKKVKKKFIRLMIKAVYFLRKMQHGVLPARTLALAACVGTLPFNHVLHNSYVLLRSFYLRILARVAVLRSQNCLFLRHTFFKEVKLNFIYKFIYWFIKKVSMFLLSLRAVYFNFTYLTSKIFMLALTGVRESCAFFRSSRSVVTSSLTYTFYNSVLFNNNVATRLGSWLAGRLASSSVVLFSDSICNARLMSSSLNLISKLFTLTNAFFVWKRASTTFNELTFNWTFLIDRRMNSLKINGLPFLVGRSLLNKFVSKRVLQTNANLSVLRRLNLVINMRVHSYAKLLERVVIGSRVVVKKPKLGFLNKSFVRSKLKFQKKAGKIVNRAIGMKRAIRLV